MSLSAYQRPRRFTHFGRHGCACSARMWLRLKRETHMTRTTNSVRDPTSEERVRNMDADTTDRCRIIYCTSVLPGMCSHSSRSYLCRGPPPPRSETDTLGVSIRCRQQSPCGQLFSDSMPGPRSPRHVQHGPDMLHVRCLTVSHPQPIHTGILFVRITSIVRV